MSPRKGAPGGGASFARRLPPQSSASGEPNRLEPWLWGLALFLLSSPFVYQLTGIDPSAELTRDLSTMRRNGASGVMIYALRYASALLALIFVLPSWRSAVSRLPRIWPVLLFAGWAILTVIWSDTVNSSINGVLALLPLLICGYCLALRLPAHVLARSYIYSGVWAAGFSILYVVFLPHYGVHQANDAYQTVHAGAWRGVYPHKNLFGGLMGAYAAITMLAGRRVLPSRAFRVCVVAVQLLLVVKSHSATALLIAAGAPLLTLALIGLSVRMQVLAALCAVPLIIIVVTQADSLLGLFGRDLTFTGRTSIWEIAPAAIAQRPFGGYGFASTAYGGFMVELYRRFGLFDPHNGYLNLLLSTGLVGLSLFVIAAVRSIQVARTLYREDAARRQGALVLLGVTSAWLIAMLSESQDKPLGSFAALGFSAFALAVYGPTRSRGGDARLKGARRGAGVGRSAQADRDPRAASERTGV